MSENEPKDPKQALRVSLAEARRMSRGVKESARNLRAIPKSGRLEAITEEAVAQYDAAHPAPSKSDDTTVRIPR